MATPSVPIIAALPQFAPAGSRPRAPDDLAAASPILQALLQQTGGLKGLENVNSVASSQPQFAQLLSFMSPGGGINPQQAQSFGPLFGLLMSLMGGGGQGQGPLPGMGL